MLQSLLWDDEVRDADFETLKGQTKVSPQEAKMAASLVDNMSADFNPDKFSDDYQAQLKELIAAKLEQGDSLDTATTFGGEADAQSGGGDVVDLMEALRQSVERNRASRSSPGTAEKKAPAKKSAAKKKTPAKKKTADKKAS